MITNIPAKAVTKWVENNAAMIDEWWIERDEFGGRSSPYSIWLYLVPGYICTGMEAHLIHEVTAKDFLAMAETIRPCNCERCAE